jgi:hypothetical protein
MGLLVLLAGLVLLFGVPLGAGYICSIFFSSLLITIGVPTSLFLINGGLVMHWWKQSSFKKELEKEEMVQFLEQESEADDSATLF